MEYVRLERCVQCRIRLTMRDARRPLHHPDMILQLIE